jgi:hypothetical protein
VTVVQKRPQERLPAGVSFSGGENSRAVKSAYFRQFPANSGEFDTIMLDNATLREQTCAP